MRARGAVRGEGLIKKMAYYFYIKKVGAASFVLGTTPSPYYVELQGGEIVYKIKGWNHEVVTPWEDWARHKLRNHAKADGVFDLNTPGGARDFEELKIILNTRKLTPVSGILYRVLCGLWWIHRAWVWILFNSRGRGDLVYYWEEAVPFPSPPRSRVKKVFHYKLKKHESIVG